MDGDARRKVMAGARLRRLRAELGLSQGAMAAELGVSVSYVNLVERDQRPVTAQLLIRLAETYGVDARDFARVEGGQGAAELEEVLAHPLLAELRVPRAEVRAALEAAPTLVEALRRLHAAYAEAAELASAAGAGGEAERGAARPEPAGDPVERVRAFLQEAGNHFPALEEAAEAIAEGLDAAGPGHDPLSALSARLRARHGVRVQLLPHREMGVSLRHYDRHRRRLMVSDLVEPAGVAFQAATQLGLLEAGPVLDGLLAGSGLDEGQARTLGRVTLANYLAGALLMPYAPFLAAAQELGYDVEALGARFGASWEQVAHRLTTLSRPAARGIPFFMVRVDDAGNVSKRFSSGAFPFSRWGGTCPRWSLHDAFRQPGRVLAEVVELPDGKRWLTVARTARRHRPRWGEREATFAVGLGCEARWAPQLVYGQALGEPTGIGVNCRLCPRPACPSRAAPPLAGGLALSEATRGLSPFGH